MTSPTPENTPSVQRFKEYQDPHYHDEVDVVIPDETPEGTKKASVPRKPGTQRRFPMKRRFHEED
jgi:hypothetical protein